jgi:hypothetical protein
MTDSISLNNNLIKFDNLITSLEYLYEEINTRKNNIVADIDLDEKIHQEFNSNRFKSKIAEYIRDEYGSSIFQEVALIVMEKIDGDIQQFITERVNQTLRASGIMPRV